MSTANPPTAPICDTVRLERRIRASLDATWAAFADTSARTEWGVPEGEAQEYLVDDFVTGGRARLRCGAPGELEFENALEYVRIDPRQVVTYTETVRHGDDLLAAALLTWTLERDPDAPGDETLVGVVAQVVSFVGPDMIDGYRNGHEAALTNLERLLVG